MGIINRRVTIAAGTKDPDVLLTAGEPLRELRASGTVRLGIATNADAGDVSCEVHVGQQQVAADYDADIDSNANVDPQKHLKIITTGVKGDPIRVAATNGNAAAKEVTIYGIVP